MAQTKDYLLRDLPLELHRKVKVQAAEEGITMRAWIIRALQAFIEERRER